MIVDHKVPAMDNEEGSCPKKRKICRNCDTVIDDERQSKLFHRSLCISPNSYKDNGRQSTTRASSNVYSRKVEDEKKYVCRRCNEVLNGKQARRTHRSLCAALIDYKARLMSMTSTPKRNKKKFIEEGGEAPQESPRINGATFQSGAPKTPRGRPKDKSPGIQAEQGASQTRFDASNPSRSDNIIKADEPSRNPGSAVIPSSNVSSRDFRGLCIICMELDVKTVFLPCRHAICCAGCAEEVDLCPLCRSAISVKLDVYFS